MSIAVMIPHVILHIMSYYSVLFVSADIKAVEINRPFIIMCGFFFIFLPSRKKLAWTFRSFSPSRRTGVYFGLGPSSKVSATLGLTTLALPSVCTVSSFRTFAKALPMISKSTAAILIPLFLIATLLTLYSLKYMRQNPKKHQKLIGISTSEFLMPLYLLIQHDL